MLKYVARVCNELSECRSAPRCSTGTAPAPPRVEKNGSKGLLLCYTSSYSASSSGIQSGSSQTRDWVGWGGHYTSIQNTFLLVPCENRQLGEMLTKYLFIFFILGVLMVGVSSFVFPFLPVRRHPLHPSRYPNR